MKMAWILLSNVVILILSGCGGNANVVSSPSTTTPQSNFTNWPAMPSNETILATGTAVEGDRTRNRYNQQLSGIQYTDSVLFSTEYDQSGNILKAVFSPKGTDSVAFDSTSDWTNVYVLDANADIFWSSEVDNSNANYNRGLIGGYAIVANPTKKGWDFQSYGIWEEGVGDSSGTAGAISYGSLSEGSNIPTIGTATYTGNSSGKYVKKDQADAFTQSTVTASVDFSARNVLFNSTNTEFVTDTLFINPTLINNTSYDTNNSTYDFSGNLSYSQATNSITGTVTSSGSGMTGTIKSSFFGPNAEEMGGVFELTSSDSKETYIGAFGAKQ